MDKLLHIWHQIHRHTKMQPISIITTNSTDIAEQLESRSTVRSLRSSCKVMDGYPVLQIVRCRLGPDSPMEGTMGYPFAMATHSHSHMSTRNGNHPHHLTRNHYGHPCGTFFYTI